MSELETASAVEQAEPVTPDAIMQLGFAFWGSKTLLSAVEMRLFAVLSNAGPLDAEQLRERLGLHPRGARDFFDALGNALSQVSTEELLLELRRRIIASRRRNTWDDWDGGLDPHGDWHEEG